MNEDDTIIYEPLSAELADSKKGEIVLNGRLLWVTPNAKSNLIGIQTITDTQKKSAKYLSSALRERHTLRPKEGG